MEISYLNHASVIIKHNEISLLSDPWFFGYCFEDGWGLQYDNPEALKKAAECTHLWVSHFHQDHFHKPTLEKLLEINPEIIFIGNRSYNFKLDDAARGLGFKNILSLEERVPLRLNDDFIIIRYPTTGIDNMLHIKTNELSILNYNDCSLPARSQKMLRKKIGHIDYLLTNFNHAGKLLLYPYPDAAVIKKKLVNNFSNNYSIFNPDYILPFASYHYYKAPESFNQNDAMLDISDLIHLDNRIIGWTVGNKLTINGQKPILSVESQPAKNTKEKIIRSTGFLLPQIMEAASQFSKTLNKRFSFFIRSIPTLYIIIRDLNILVGFHPSKGCFIPEKKVVPHISTHSSALFNWFTKPFGTDSFAVGAHFDIINNNRIPLKWQLTISLLVENKIDLLSVLKMLFKKRGIKFLYNRREEILGILTSFKIFASYHDD